MSRIIRSTPRRTHILSALVVAILAASAANAQAQSSRLLTSGTFSAPFRGVGANDKDLSWTGARGGSAAGEMVILLADKGPAIESNRRVWEVEGIVFLSGTPEESFAAEVEGTIDWKQGTMVLRGRITAGRLSGAAFQQTAELRQLDLRGHWRAERIVATK
jgi:hypothetical protein